LQRWWINQWDNNSDGHPMWQLRCDMEYLDNDLGPRDDTILCSVSASNHFWDSMTRPPLRRSISALPTSSLAPLPYELLGGNRQTWAKVRTMALAQAHTPWLYGTLPMLDALSQDSLSRSLTPSLGKACYHWLSVDRGHCLRLRDMRLLRVKRRVRSELDLK